MASGSSKQSGTRAAGKAVKAESQALDDGGQAAAKLVAMLRPGACFSVWTSDYDASDLYQLRIDELKPDGAMVLSFPDPPAESKIRCSAEAVERGSGVVFLSQYSAVADKSHSRNHLLSTKTHSPPFLLSRDSLRRLKAGETVPIEVYSGTVAVKLHGKAQATVRIHEQPFKVPVLHAQDQQETDWSPVDLWVLDHPEWPLLLKLEFGGECELSLFEVKPAG